MKSFYYNQLSTKRQTFQFSNENHVKSQKNDDVIDKSHWKNRWQFTKNATNVIIRILILIVSKKYATNIFMKFEKSKNHVKLNFSKMLLTKKIFWHTNSSKITDLKNCFWSIIMKICALILIKNAMHLLMLCFHFFRTFRKIRLVISSHTNFQLKNECHHDQFWSNQNFHQQFLHQFSKKFQNRIIWFFWLFKKHIKLYQNYFLWFFHVWSTTKFIQIVDVRTSMQFWKNLKNRIILYQNHGLLDQKSSRGAARAMLSFGSS